MICYVDIHLSMRYSYIHNKSQYELEAAKTISRKRKGNSPKYL